MCIRDRSSYQMPIVVVLMNNTVLGMVRQWQKLFYGRRFSQTDPHRKTDFVELARAFGVEGLRITRELSLIHISSGNPRWRWNHCQSSRRLPRSLRPRNRPG